jgi:membrane protease subunit HflK
MSDNNQKDPWSGRNHQTPPDLIEIISKFFKKTNKTPDNGSTEPENNEAKSIGIILALVLVVIAVIWFISGFFILSPTDQAPILRFGRYTQTVGPGLHWIPRLVDNSFPVNTNTINRINVSADMLTQDENIVTVEIAVQYRIVNAKNYLFNVVNPVGSLKQVTSSAMRQVIGDNTLDDILTTGRQKVREDIEQVMVKTLTPYKTGIQITDVNLQPAKPPAAVTAAFDDAINAREDKQKFMNKAQAYQNQVISMVKGQQSRIMQEAEAYKTKVSQEAKGNTSRYLALLKPYQKSPEIMRNKMYYDTLTNVFKHTTNVINNTDGRSMIYLSPQGASTGKSSKNSDTQTAHMIASATAVPGLQGTGSSELDNASAVVNPYDSSGRPSYSVSGDQS